MASLSGDDTGTGYGVRGMSNNGSGVIGKSDTAVGTVGQSVTGTGVEGDCDFGDGVRGRSSTGSGVSGHSQQGRGVSGNSDLGVGVFGKSVQDNGVLGVTESPGRAGVFGLNTDGGNGVVGIAEGVGGIGVFGNAEKRGVGVVGTGATGVLGQGDAGPGVQASSKQDHGVRGRAELHKFAGVRGDNPMGTGVEGHGLRGVVGNGDDAGVVGRHGPPPATGWPTPAGGVEGRSTKGQPGVVGITEGSYAKGVVGKATGGLSIGVEGSGDEIGVSGHGTRGVYGETSTALPFGAGVMGKTNVKGAAAVWGSAEFSADGVKGHTDSGTGVLGQTTGSFGTGVVGVSPNTENVGPFGFAARFQGAINVTGSVHKSGGGFRIDHPIEPESKFLDHSFVESDEMKNIYDGVVELDADGNAVVQLPSWFEVLNTDFRYQLTALGAPARDLHVRREVADGRFEIAGGRPGQRISWQVTGRRQDLWARAHPLMPEVNKVEIEQGRYRHPELYGLPRERGIEFALYGESIEATEQALALLQDRDRDRAEVTDQ